jgi:MFS family permease
MPTPSLPVPPSTVLMTPLERRASVSLASIFALRMLGLFLVLPVFALEAAKYPHGDDPGWVGLAMGVYGLTQALLQLPMGMASDRWGRKPVMIVGLLIFAAGSLIAAWAPSMLWLVIGRSIQGAGAISAAVTAFLADLTRDEVRTKSMALVGASIGLMFALSLVLSPVLAGWMGLSGLFGLTAALAVGGLAVVVWWVPAEAAHKPPSGGGFRQVLRDTGLLRLNLGVFVLHAVQLSMWVAVPALLVQAGLAKNEHWTVYLPAVLASFLLMGAVFPLERRGYLRAVFLGAVALIGSVQLGFLVVASGTPQVWSLGALLTLFFVGFNVLEATQPSLVSRLAPVAHRGTAMGTYNTLQSLGLFAGGAIGGWMAKKGGSQLLFVGCSVMMLLWLLIAWGMRTPELKSMERR